MREETVVEDQATHETGLEEAPSSKAEGVDIGDPHNASTNSEEEASNG